MPPLTCPNGHAMDEGYFNCPACGAYRPSVHDSRAVIENGVVVGMTRPRPGHGPACGVDACIDCWQEGS